MLANMPSVVTRIKFRAFTPGVGFMQLVFTAKT